MLFIAHGLPKGLKVDEIVQLGTQGAPAVAAVPVGKAVG